MKKLITAVVIGLLGLAVAVSAQGPGYGPGWGGGGPGWGPGMMGPGYGWRGMGPGMMYGCPEYGGSEYGPSEAAISVDKAKEIAKEYTEKYLKGFTVERVLPFTGMRNTMYGVELKGPKDEVRYLHINPWGGVMPFAGGPSPRS